MSVLPPTRSLAVRRDDGGAIDPLWSRASGGAELRIVVSPCGTTELVSFACDRPATSVFVNADALRADAADAGGGRLVGDRPLGSGGAGRLDLCGGSVLPAK